VTSWTASIRFYPHFDAVISAAAAEAVVRDPKQVASHSFFPFLKYDEGWTMFAPKGFRGDRKDRPIRFAARLDSCIFSYYRHLLSAPYEARLAAEGLSESVIAYRRIPKAVGNGGKSNIDFALAAVETARGMRNCCAVALDISKFFEHLDHARLRDVWADLLGTARLPNDHYKVFEAITRYAYVDVIQAYERLGLYGEKKDKAGKVRKGYLCSKKEIPLQLCDGKTFRKKIASPKPDIIEVNRDKKGVPQGAPLSDLLANAYLLEFDKHVRDICARIGGTYFRYSDDILVVAPISRADAIQLESDIRAAITVLGKGLVIKEEKSAIHEFVQVGDRQTITVVKATAKDGKPALNKPFEYLGFRYDGEHVFIRDKTMSNLHRKIASVSQATAIRLRKRYQGKTIDEIMELVDFEKLVQAFGPVEDFRKKADNYRSWTFMTYAKRASKAMGALGKPIARQLRGLRKAISERLEYELTQVRS
jgi:hypothetical protein